MDLGGRAAPLGGELLSRRTHETHRRRVADVLDSLGPDA